MPFVVICSQRKAPLILCDVAYPSLLAFISHSHHKALSSMLPTSPALPRPLPTTLRTPSFAPYSQHYLILGQRATFITRSMGKCSGQEVLGEKATRSHGASRNRKQRVKKDGQHYTKVIGPRGGSRGDAWGRIMAFISLLKINR